MVYPGRLRALMLCNALLAAAPAAAEPPDGCASLYDAATRAHDATDVFVSVERFDGTAPCFLVPRAVTDKRLRSHYADGRAAAEILAFDPTDLLEHVKDKQSLLVGSEEREVALDKLSCLAEPTPSSVYVVSPYVATPTTVKTILTFAKESTADLPGYLRYFDAVADYYLKDVRPDSQVSFFCRRVPELSRDLCLIVGDYDELTVVVTYQKVEMTSVQPETALQCVRTIAELFRVTKPVHAN